MNQGLMSFTPDPERDPDGSKLFRMLEATMVWGRIRTIREWILRAVAAASVPVGVATMRPALLPQVVRGMGLWAWAAGCVALVVAWIAEWRCRKLLARYQEDASPMPARPRISIPEAEAARR